MMQRKTEEGMQLVGEALFQECWKFFCLISYSVSEVVLMWGRARTLMRKTCSRYKTLSTRR